MVGLQSRSIHFKKTMKRDALSALERSLLLKAARAAMSHAYAPYSKFKVGAALLTASGQIFSGCNVENSSYGMTNCAERTAVFSAIAKLGPRLRIRAVAVVNNRRIACSPCGACRQVIYEFGPDAVILFRGLKTWNQVPLRELLPAGFELR
jgi:cytidine deaminase